MRRGLPAIAALVVVAISSFAEHVARPVSPFSRAIRKADIALE